MAIQSERRPSCAEMLAAADVILQQSSPDAAAIVHRELAAEGGALVMIMNAQAALRS